MLVNGARQTGKSTLTRLVADRVEPTVLRLLDDPAVLLAAEDDPVGFVDHDGLMVIDEIQLRPELLRPIKLTVDLDPKPGQFLLTGSSRVLALRTLPDALHTQTPCLSSVGSSNRPDSSPTECAARRYLSSLDSRRSARGFPPV